MSRQIIEPDREYTFHDYFKMRVSTEDILAYFGYQKQNARLKLPRSNSELPFLESLFSRVEDTLLHISLENEFTRREFLIAPVMHEVRRLTKAKLNSEYWFEFNFQLKGSLDYLLRREQNLLVIDAKNADMSRGFTQLAVEMIAFDKADESTQPKIYGAVTTGNIWQFGELDRRQKTIKQDIVAFDLLKELENLVRILVGVLEQK